MKTKMKTKKPTELVCEVYYKGLRKHLKEFLKEESECETFDVGYALDELDDIKEIVQYGRQMFNDYFDEYDKEENHAPRKLMKPAVKSTKEKEIKKAVHSIYECEDPKCNLHNEEEE
jgi:hypothetical protein